MKKIPLLDVLTGRDPDTPRETLYARIICGDIAVNGSVVKNPKTPVSVDASISEVSRAFVSRGGDKLAHAIDVWGVSVSGKVFLDAGSSTGGFTDCLLKNGATAVHAVDVGYNQIAYELRTNQRVILRERTNIMSIDELEPVPHAAVADLSFRSLRGAAGHILGLTLEKWAIVLVKPQFEYRGSKAEFDGVVRNPEDIRAALEDLFSDLSAEGIGVSAITESPVAGRKGNREFLCRAEAETGGITSEIRRFLDGIYS